MVVYISGAMSGLPNANRDAFYEMEAHLTLLGYAVLNPAWIPDGLSYSQYIAIDIAMLSAARYMLVLPGSDKSKGVAAEVAVAESLGIKTVSLEALEALAE